MLLSINKQYAFFVKIKVRKKGDRIGRHFIADEVQPVQNAIPINKIDEDITSETTIKEITRTENDTDDTIPQKRIKLNKDQ